MFLKKVLVHQTRHERMCHDGTKLSINGTYNTATGDPQATTEYDEAVLTFIVSTN